MWNLKIIFVRWYGKLQKKASGIILSNFGKNHFFRWISLYFWTNWIIFHTLKKVCILTYARPPPRKRSLPWEILSGFSNSMRMSGYSDISCVQVRNEELTILRECVRDLMREGPLYFDLKEKLRILSMEYYVIMLCITISITRLNVRCDGQTMFAEIFQNYLFLKII